MGYRVRVPWGHSSGVPVNMEMGVAPGREETPVHG